MRLSVVIPSRNAGDALAAALEGLATQDVPVGTFEVIVVDRSSDDTVERLRRVDTRFPLRIVRQVGRGRGAALNQGVANAGGDVLLFMDADVIPRPGLLEGHLRHYEVGGSLRAVQGRTVADPATLITPFMRTENMLPDLTRRRRGDMAPFHVLGRNFSVSRAGFDAVGGFDEAFRNYGWEDIEFAVRFHKAHGRIMYEPEALAVHRHPITVEAASARQRENGRGAVYFWRKHGRPLTLGFQLEVHPLLLPLKWLVYRTGPATRFFEAIRPWAERRNLLLVLNECYHHMTWRGFYQGVFEAFREPPPPVSPRLQESG
jgi:glycosyltransferase involved in cell wall biosynthesis